MKIMNSTRFGIGPVLYTTKIQVLKVKTVEIGLK